jgi:hypothetical protein
MDTGENFGLLGVNLVLGIPLSEAETDLWQRNDHNFCQSYWLLVWQWQGQWQLSLT